MSLRIFAVLQLCLVFSAICWYGLYPFTGELYEIRSELFMARTVMGDPDLLTYDKGAGEELQKNRVLFNEMSYQERKEIENRAIFLGEQMQAPFLSKVYKGSYFLLFELPIVKRAWIFMALAISIGLLLSIQGAFEAAWLLPVLAAVYLAGAIESPMEPSRLETLYPKELSGNGTFQEQWDEYIEKTWGTKFAFNVALLDAYKDRVPLQERKEAPLVCLLYFAWNLCFAYSVSRGNNHAKTARKSPMDSSSHTP